MSRTRFRRCPALIGLTVGMALVLTSCFGGDDETDDSTTTTQQSATTTQATTVEPQPTTTEVVVIEPPTTTAVIVVETPPPAPADAVEPQPPPPPVDPNAPLIYTVQPGDTLYSIARQFGVSVDELIEFNNIANPDVIYVDDTLTIPPAG